MAFHVAGGGFDDFNQWSAQPTHTTPKPVATFRSFKTAPGGVGAGALFGMARDHGWQDGTASPRPAPTRPTTKSTEPPRKPAPHGCP
ncbi:MAG: hypothetical protein IPH54_22460 [Rhodoferax sp.]|nr:hypothetical protein [Rhodoferax sp.]